MISVDGGFLLDGRTVRPGAALASAGLATVMRQNPLPPGLAVSGVQWEGVPDTDEDLPPS